MPTPESPATLRLNRIVQEWMLEEPATAALFCALSRKHRAELHHAQLSISGFSAPCFSFGAEIERQVLKAALLLWMEAGKKKFSEGNGILRLDLHGKKISAEKKDILTKNIILQLNCQPAQAAWQTRYLIRALQRWARACTEAERQTVWGETVEKALSVLTRPEQASISWQRILRKQMGRHQRSRPLAHRHRLSKRYGSPPGLRIRRLRHLAIAVDTSGSVEEKELAVFQAEINALRRYGHRITLIQFDDRIRWLADLRGPAPDLWRGRGNTLYDPVLRWANRHRPDILLIFTDGQGPLPLEKYQGPLWWIRPPQIAPSFQQIRPSKKT